MRQLQPHQYDNWSIDLDDLIDSAIGDDLMNQSFNMRVSTELG
jgi:hypothetical protein